jgi:hypothetical protein
LTGKTSQKTALLTVFTRVLAIYTQKWVDEDAKKPHLGAPLAGLKGDSNSGQTV